MSRSNHKEGTTAMQRIGKYFAIAAVATGITFSGLAPASATGTQPAPGQVAYAVSSSNVQNTVISTGVVTNDSSGKIVLKDVNTKSAPKQTVPKKHKLTRVERKYGYGCTFVKDAYNSGLNPKGSLKFFRDHNMVVCPDKYSPTGLIKVAGGMTGRNCRNVVRLLNKPPAKRDIVPANKVIMVVSFSHTSTVQSVATTLGVASSQASCSVNGASASSTAYGSAYGYASATASATGKTVVEARTNATRKLNPADLRNSATTNAFTAAAVKLSTSASAYCQGAPVTFSCPLGSTTNNAGTACVKAGNTTPPEAPQPAPAIQPQPAPAPQPVVVIQPAPAPQPCDVGSTRDSSGVCVKNAATTPAPVANPIPGGTTTPVGIDPAPAPSGSPAPVDAPPYVAPAPSQCYDATGATVPSTDPTALFCS